jgi:hypothetical protein
LRDGCVDLVLFLTALEFFETPDRALAEAARVARAGLIVMALNRWSRGGWSRRWGRDSGGSLLQHARDFSLRELRDLIRGSVRRPIERIYWKSTVFPVPLHRAILQLPFGDVLGMAIVFRRATTPRTEGQISR